MIHVKLRNGTYHQLKKVIGFRNMVTWYKFGQND